ncbi:expressed unknown protein [Seminavis robusta]|uniref:Uncharacterized protein n=1 Tax=Seminavis robusta TaxID=568900 RepID=A0A9N8E8F5_9STRA|nr:expressed unknown protein [Seminavis robusta]|eukprot:Sro660_g183020.1 n/a (112) ;mRNA; r:29105-29440
MSFPTGNFARWQGWEMNRSIAASTSTPGDLISSDVTDSNLLRHMLQFGDSNGAKKVSLRDDEDDNDNDNTSSSDSSMAPKHGVERPSFMCDGVYLPPPTLQRNVNRTESKL